MTGITVAQSDHFQILTMHNNGVFNPDSLKAFNEALNIAEVDEKVQGLIITGEGKNFSQGLDLEYLMTLAPKDFMRFVDETMEMIARLLSYPVPVINVVNGHAFGLGAMIVLAGDYSVMRQDRGFICLPEIDLAMPFIPSMNALVVNKLPAGLKRDMMLTGRRVGGEEAFKYSLVDRCGDMDDLMDIAKTLAEPMMGKKRNALSKIKTGMNQDILDAIKPTPQGWSEDL